MSRKFAHHLNGATSLVAATLILAATSTAGAEGQLDAHVHGVGQLNVAVEGNEVEIELISPGADIVGFEHEPTSDADKMAVSTAVETLENGGNLFTFPAGAACELEEAEVASAQLIGEEDDHASHAHEAHDDHADEHDHGHDDHDDHADEGGHAEFHAHYHFHCDNPDALTHVDVNLFEHFERAGELEVQALTPNGQQAAELTPGAARLEF